MKTFLTAVFTSLLLALPAAVQAQFNFTTNNGAVTITRYTGSDGAVVIPDSTNGYSVTSIGFGAFAQTTNLTSVIIPDSVTNIGNSAFSECSNLTSVVIGHSVTSIGDYAFNECNSLTNVTLPDSMTSIGNFAFYECFNLVSANLPNSINSLGYSAFYDCHSLTHVDIPSNITSIEFNAFSGCTNLTSVVISGSVINLRSQAFSYCSALTSVLFQGNTPIIGNDGYDVFYGVNATAVVYYLYGTTGWGSTYGKIVFPGTGVLPTVLLNPPINAGNISVETNGFTFLIPGSSNQVVVIEASTNFVNWLPLQTNAPTAMPVNFTDSQWMNYPQRFYRVRYYVP